MQRILLFCSLTFLLSGVYAQLTLTDSLAAWYPMDGNALDASGNGNHATPFGAVLTADRNGTPNAAYQFDGFNDYLSVSNNQDLNPDLPITIAAWVRMDDLNANNIFQSDHDAANYYGYWLTIVQSGRVYISLGDNGPIGPPSRRSKGGSSQLSTGIWYHVAGVIRSAFDMSIYINGKEDCGFYNGTGNLIPIHDYGSGTIGRSTGETFFHGAIDDIRFYRRELSKAEIRILADFPPQDSSICPGTSLQLDAGYGSVVSWSPTTSLNCTGCTTPFAAPITQTSYLAITQNTPGCLDSVEIDIGIDNCPVLPVELLAFEGQWQEEKIVLNWTSTAERQLAHYLLERSRDGMGFSPLQQVIAKGTHTGNASYRFQDQGAPSSTSVYYRLKQVDLNGAYSYSSIVEVKPQPNALSLHVFPNPAKAKLQIRLRQPIRDGQFMIQSLNGQIILQQAIQDQQTLTVDVSAFAKGSYLLRVSGADQVWHEQFQVFP